MAFRLSARLAIRSGIGWGLVFGLVIATSALGYATAYKTAASRNAFATAFSTNAGLNAVTGRAVAIETVGGYTVWKSLAALSIFAAVWGLTRATRQLRGEEESGRLELLLSGQTTKRRATVQILLGMGIGFVALFAVTSLIAVAVGHTHSVGIGADPMLFFALSTVAAAAMFLVVGSVLSQIAATRRQATAFASAVLAASYALRMVADSGSSLSWLRWTTPLGWIEELQPLTSPRPFALVPIALCAALGAVTAVWLSGTRDFGASVLADRSSAPARTWLLSGPFGLAVRLARATDAAWMLGIAATAMLLGFVAKQAGGSFSSTPSIERALGRLGLHGSGASTYLGLSFLIVAIYVGFLAVSSTVTMRGEEAGAVVESFLVRPIPRWRWFFDRGGLIAVVVLISGLLAGLFTWVGAASTHAGASISSLLQAGCNIVPPALCLLGISLLVMGILPRATEYVAYGLLIWSFLVKLLGDVLRLSHWIIDTSVFQQMAPAPAVHPDWTTNVALLLCGLVTAVIGGFAFSRRDLVGR